MTLHHKRKKIVFFYDGTELQKQEILDALAKCVPEYMMPGKVIYLKSMPHNANGKIDRLKLQDFM